MKVIVNSDGGVRTGGIKGPTGGKTGRAAIGIVIKDEDNTVLLKDGMVLEDDSTVNDAEYSGVLFGLYEAEGLGATHVEVRSDSQLVVMQVNGVWACREPHLREYLAEVHTQVKHFDEVEFVWVPREQNQPADQITRDLLDAAVAS